MTDDIYDDPIVPVDRAPRAVSSSRKWVTTGIAALAFVAVGAVLAKGIGDAALFFRNADEAVAEHEELGQKRFKVQGLVVAESVEQFDDIVLFTIEFNEVGVDVAYKGVPPQLFAEGLAVVLEGQFRDGDAPANTRFGPFASTSLDNYYFAADRILVKHDEVYIAENADRLTDAVDGSDQ